MLEKKKKILLQKHQFQFEIPIICRVFYDKIIVIDQVFDCNFLIALVLAAAVVVEK